jgi:FtsZ-interacting cell division protein ZipA
MDTFRLTLIFLGLAVLFIIYLLETQRRRKLKQGQRDRQREPSLDGGGHAEDTPGDMLDDVPDMPANLNIDDFRAHPSALNGGGPGASAAATHDEDMVAGTPIGAGILGRETLGAPRYSPPDPVAGNSPQQPPPFAVPTAGSATSPATAGAKSNPIPADAPTPAIAVPTPRSGTPTAPAPTTPVDAMPATPAAASDFQEADEVPDPPEGMPELIIALQLSAPDEGTFNGRELQEALRHCNMEYGPMQIYHYYTPRRRTLFYLANAQEPGSFDLTSMTSLSTTGVLFFLRLPTVIAGREAFDIMLETAREVCDRVNGILRDQQGASLGKHELILIRERIAEYEYKAKQRRRELG